MRGRVARGIQSEAMWFPVEAPWQYRILDCLKPGIDEAQLARARAMSPTERIDAAIALMETAEAFQRALAKKKASR
jgi:hypothetical protein